MKTQNSHHNIASEPSEWPDSILNGTEMARRIYEHDWSTTSIGAINTWPQSLRVLVKTILSCSLPMSIVWGPDYVPIYNDAYIPIAGATHPGRLGRPTQENWSEIWEDILKPIIQKVQTTGKAIVLEDKFFPLCRFGFIEEVYGIASYSPLFDDHGKISGILHVITETTSKVLGERRLGLLQELSRRTSEGRSVKEACQIVSDILKKDPKDIPFALIYKLDSEKKHARLVATSNIPFNTSLSPTVIDLSQSDAQNAWPINQVMASGIQQLDDFEARFGILSGNPWPEPVQKALILPIVSQTHPALLGFLIAGISPRLQLDEHYREFLSSLTTQIATAISNAQAYEEELRSKMLTEARFKRIFESNMIGITFANYINGEIIDANDAFLKMIGYSREELDSQKISWKAITPSEYLPINEIALQELLANGISNPYEKQYIHKDGHPIDVMLGLAVLEPEKQTAVAFVLDISKRKKLEREKQETLDWERGKRKILESLSKTMDLSDILHMGAQQIGRCFDVDRCMVYLYNKTLSDQSHQRLLGSFYGQYVRSPDLLPVAMEDIPLNLLNKLILHKDSRFPSVIQKFSSPADFPDFYLEYAQKYQVQSVLALEITYQDIAYGILVLHQCSSSRAWEDKEIEQLQDIATYLGVAFYQADLFQKELEARIEAELANQKKSEFLTTVTHELRTPLSSIIGYSEMLEGEYGGPLSEKQTKYTHNILSSSQHLLSLVDDLLDVASMDTGNITISPTIVDLAPIIEDLKTAFTKMASDKQVSLQFEIAPGLAQIYSDPMRFKQILYHLISNGIKFNHKGGRVDIHLSITQDHQWLICQIHDTGIGIPQGKISELFKPFSRLDTSYARRTEGTGLGLVLTKYLIERQGGHIIMESQEGVGSTFTFYLPMKSLYNSTSSKIAG